MDFAKMHSLSDSIFAQASALHAHALRQLAGAEHSLDCCTLSHQVSSPALVCLWLCLCGCVCVCLCQRLCPCLCLCLCL